MNKNRQLLKMAKICGVVAVCVLMIIFGVVLAQPKEIRISEKNDNEATTVLDCKSSVATLDAFFVSDVADDFMHEVKLIFDDDDNFSTINYTYSGVFNSEEDAGTALSLMHADYNIYMGKTNIYQEDLYPTFSVLGARGIVNLFIERNDLTVDTAKFIFLDSEQYEEVDEMTIDEVKMLYESKGFVCKIN